MEVWLTSHILVDMPNTTRHLRKRFDEQKAAYEGDVTSSMLIDRLAEYTTSHKGKKSKEQKTYEYICTRFASSRDFK